MNEKLTKDQLEEIRQRVVAATGGKWFAEVNDGLMNHRTYYRVFSDIETDYSEVTFLIHKLENKEDANFIANAHQDIPKLLDHIAFLNEVISSCRCAECGDELGEDWATSSGVAFCNCCAGLNSL
ncbi:hypothetical protein P9H15_10340 [Bacillus velezensis]|uniref:hypothetical protein n=1 Tax=Bacillus velezensis TaxID=492670 RepID=UPI002DBDAF19|nr:hypothetical protein [Bacillus velezensis]MEC2354093.1 hypothetical protein [Bacillus velezensis]